MNSQGAYNIRRMNRDDIETCVSWAATEGWNPGLNDAGCFYEADRNGFFIGELDGKPVGSISAVAYGKTFGFIGLYIVRPEFRGKGYGIQLWNAAMEYLEGRNIGLDGVVEQQDNYKKSGFRLAYRNVRYEGTGGGKSSADVVSLSDIPFETVLEYDRLCFPVRRETFMRCWLNQPNAESVGKMDRDSLRGFGTIRQCGSGYKIGPLFADNEEIAEELFTSLASKADGGPIYLDVPEVNPAAVALAKRHGMEIVFETARMYTKDDPDIDVQRTYGVTTFELG